MRVLILASGDLWAGAEVMLYQLCCGLRSFDDVDVLVVLLNDNRLAKDLEAAGIEVRIIDEGQLSIWGLVKRIYHTVNEFLPHIIHSHGYKQNLLSWLVTRVMCKVCLVATQHGMPETARVMQSLVCRLRIVGFFRLLSFCFDHTVFVSEEMREFLVGSYGFTTKDVSVIHNGIYLSSKVIQRANDRLIVGSAGRLFPVKDFSLMVDIAYLVALQIDTVDFVLAGDGPERLILERKVRKYNLQDRFKFLGHQDDMDAFYRSLDVYINTSVHEGIPMSVLEAMSYSLPVVVPKVGGLPEIVEEGITGYLIEVRDPTCFVEKILSLLIEDCRRPMAAAARQRVEDCFSMETMARKYYNLYQELVNK